MIIRRLLLASVVLLGGIQLVRPARTNPPGDPSKTINATLAVDPGVAAILARSCYDCHSNGTVWPWYSAVAPASWLVAHDVNGARRKLNFSAWGAYDSQKMHTLLSQACQEVSDGRMPIAAYKLIHRNAALSAADVQAICRWTQNASPANSAVK
jgi:Haem-binding domain